MQKTNIAWAECTWNPVVGCTKCSPGCENCYAERMAARLNGIFAAKGDDDNWARYSNILKFDTSQREEGRAVGWNGQVELCYDRLEQPLHWRKPRMIFVPSMGDLFHPAVPFEFIDKVMAVIALCPQHTFQVLTKRAERMREYFNEMALGKRHIGDSLRKIGQEGFVQRLVVAKSMMVGKNGMPPYKTPANLWLGVTCCNQQEADKNIPFLLQTPAAVRFLSLEPLLGPIDLTKTEIPNTSGGGFGNMRCSPLAVQKGTYNSIVSVCLAPLDWVIIGAESGPKRRPCKLEYVYSIAEQCKEAGVLLFIKQLDIDGKLVRDIEKFPKDLRIRQMPGKEGK